MPASPTIPITSTPLDNFGQEHLEDTAADKIDGSPVRSCPDGHEHESLHYRTCGRARRNGTTELSRPLSLFADSPVTPRSIMCDMEFFDHSDSDCLKRQPTHAEIAVARAKQADDHVEPTDTRDRGSMVTNIDVYDSMASPDGTKLDECHLPPLPVAYSTGPWEPHSSSSSITTAAAVNINKSREKVKSVFAALTVVAVTFAIYFCIKKQHDVFEKPTCEDHEPTGATEASTLELPRSCEPCGVETLTFVPMFGEYEKSLPKLVKGAFYFVGILWVFLGIGIVCDQFMAAIEEITSKQKTVLVELRPGAKQKFMFKIWNPTVANLTLMALGSSAPEILLNVIELYGNSFFAGELGPSTIVGSAAFNLLVITAVCISALPAGELRKIEERTVFGVTAFFSLFAYAWLVVILQLITPDRVSVEEAVITFTFFPIVVVLAYLADKGLLCPHRNAGRQNVLLAAEVERIKTKYGKDLPKEQMLALLRSQSQEQTRTVATKAQIRKALTGSLTGGKRLIAQKSTESLGCEELTFGFKQSNYMVFECVGEFSDVTVVASKRPGITCSMDYITRGGTAIQGERYVKSSGTITFSPFQLEQSITIHIKDNDTYEEDSYFYVQLYNLRIGANPTEARGVGPSHRVSAEVSVMSARLVNELATVTILNDDMPGTLDWETDVVYVSPGKFNLGITRTNGTTGEVSCRYRTRDEHDIAGKTYTELNDDVHFSDGQTHATVEIEVLPFSGKRWDQSFEVVLDEASLGVKFNPDKPGGRTSAICEIIVKGNMKPSICRRLCQPSDLADCFSDYVGQFQAAFLCNGSLAEQASASAGDWFFHALSLFWKVVFAFVPPPSFFGGWLCFWCALFMIGGVTALVADLAGLLGCCLGIPDNICAITLVALGTSLPDTFASKVAAQQNPNADDSIGNVTGSNCVNVFLGLGMPWTIGALYWNQSGITDAWQAKIYKGKTYKERFLDTGGHPNGGFMVPAGSLAFSVTVFSVCALACLTLLVTRRLTLGGELGGSRIAATRDSTLLVLLWLVYISLSIWRISSGAAT